MHASSVIWYKPYCKFHFKFLPKQIHTKYNSLYLHQNMCKRQTKGKYSPNQVAKLKSVIQGLNFTSDRNDFIFLSGKFFFIHSALIHQSILKISSFLYYAQHLIIVRRDLFGLCQQIFIINLIFPIISFDKCIIYQYLKRYNNLLSFYKKQNQL